MRMPQELKTKWIEALESGEYKQGKSTLCGVDGSYCCLGVLEKVVENEVERLAFPSPDFYQRNGIEPGDFTERSIIGDPVRVDTLLAEQNDHGTSFSKIANIIREKVEGY